LHPLPFSSRVPLTAGGESIEIELIIDMMTANGARPYPLAALGPALLPVTFDTTLIGKCG
jgi:hypothetical protein